MYVDPLDLGCFVDLDRLYDFLDACKSSGGKWQSDQINTICFGVVDDLLYAWGVLGSVSKLSWGCTQNNGTAKEKGTEGGKEMHHYETKAFKTKEDYATKVFRLWTERD